MPVTKSLANAGGVYRYFASQLVRLYADGLPGPGNMGGAVGLTAPAPGKVDCQFARRLTALRSDPLCSRSGPHHLQPELRSCARDGAARLGANTETGKAWARGVDAADTAALTFTAQTVSLKSIRPVSTAALTGGGAPAVLKLFY